jgi:hypothetical protein
MWVPEFKAAAVHFPGVCCGFHANHIPGFASEDPPLWMEREKTLDQYRMTVFGIEEIRVKAPINDRV